LKAHLAKHQRIHFDSKLLTAVMLGWLCSDCCRLDISGLLIASSLVHVLMTVPATAAAAADKPINWNQSVKFWRCQWLQMTWC